MSKPIVVFHPGHFFRLHDDIIDVHGPTIGANGIAIYTVLARHMGRNTGQCWPSINEIAKSTALGRSTVKKTLRKIEKVAALIESTPRRDPAGDPDTNLYTLLDLVPEAIAQRKAQRAGPQATASEGGGSGDNLPVVGQEGGGFPGDPEVGSLVTEGGFPGDPEPNTPSEPNEENQEERACADEKGEETPQEMSATAPSLTLPDRPDEALTLLDLDPTTLTTLKAEAQATLVAEGFKPSLIKKPLVESTVVKLWIQKQRACREGAVTRGMDLGQGEEQAHAVCAA